MTAAVVILEVRIIAAAIVISSDNTEKVDPLEIGNDHGKTASSRCRGFNFLK